MINIKIEVDGVKETISFVKTFEREKSGEVKKLVRDITRNTAKEIKNVTPVKSGKLKKNIRWTVKDDFYGKVYVPYGLGKAPHFHLVEFGTKFVNAIGFFFKVYNRKIDEFNRKMQQIFK